MINRIYLLLLISLVLASCSKSEPTYEILQSKTGVSFSAEGLTATWSSKSSTRGIAVDDINDQSKVPSIMVYSFLTEPNDVTSCYIDHKAATINADKTWSFKPAYYYPLTEKLDFLAYTPEANASSNGITQTLDFENKEVTINYNTPLDGRNHPDLLLAEPQTERNGDDAKLGLLEFKHALTQLSMSAKVSTNTDTKRYVITGFTLYNIITEAELKYSVSQNVDDLSWSEKYKGNFIVSAMLPDPDLGEKQVKLNKNFKSIMGNGHTLFMIPQPIENSSLSDENKPAIRVTIQDTQDGSDLTYRTERILLPSPVGYNGWEMGKHINLQFEFDVTDENLVIPMTIKAKLTPWVEQTIDKEIDANIYAFLSNEVISGNTTVTLYTNGKVTEVNPDGKVITGATLGAADSNGYYPITLTTGNKGEGTIEVKIDNSHDKSISKTFSITVKELEL